jgi:2-polyprenyl-3-methyl-5-hydroxy-6-metoxy-1,4-benzoquinol methylase
MATPRGSRASDNGDDSYRYTHAGSTDPSQGDIWPVVRGRLQRAFQGRRARILDLGCGNGYQTQRIAGLGHEVVGAEASDEGVSVARAAYPGIRFEHVSVYDEDLPAKLGDPFDAVIALEVVEHLFYPKRLFEQAHRLLRPGGQLVISTPYHGYLKNLAISVAGGWDAHFGVAWDGGHIKFFSKRTLAAMAVAAGFRDIAFRGAGRAPLLWKSMVLTATR